MKFKETWRQFHPKTDENNKKVEIHNPSTASHHDAWHDKDEHATVLPGGKLPSELHGIHFKKWDLSHEGHSDWNKVSGQGDFHEPELPKGKLSTGTIIHEPDGRVWSLSPTNSFGGYNHTVGPKGKVDDGLHHRANAIKETHEETGLKVRLTGHAFDSKRTTGTTRYYHAVRETGHPSDMGWETQAMHLTPINKLRNLVNSPLDKELADKLTSGKK